ncbi:hypothetical protein KC887_00580 [Candidatus Kaiserbacteria bacterium]|nr:hypothetical protein [Candidatus Kaiserbacteria bacterium]
MSEFKKQLDALKIRRTDNNRSGIDWNKLSQDVDEITTTLENEAGATQALGYGLRAIQAKKAELLRNFKP